MLAKMTIIQPDGSTATERRDPSNRPTLAEMQAAVGGGYIEAVDAYMPEGIEAYANEEGRLRGMARNVVGTIRVRWPYPIVGPVLVMEGFDP